MIEEAVARGEVVRVLAPYAAEGPPLVALCAPGRQRSPKVRAFVEFVAGIVA